jgi:phosphoglycolate phosphatase-like HAD superfamily hydrolase
LDLDDDHVLVYLTGRPERCRSDTQRWLDKYGFPSGQLIMRRDVDQRPARMTKLEALNRLREDRHVALIVDDDERVIDAAQDAGYLVRHATWMHSARHDQQVLFDAQEKKGRT